MWRYRLACILVVLVGFQLRLADLRTVPPGLHFDEGRNMQRAWRLSQGYNLPLHLRDIPEPFDAILRAGLMRLAGGIHPFLAQTFSVWLCSLAVAATMAAAGAIYREHPQRRWIVLGAGLTLAVMPPSVIVGRHFYRVNWVPPMSMLALAALAWSWRRPQRRLYAAAGGAFTGLGLIFYQGGIFVPPALAVAALSMVVLSRFRWPAPRQFLMMLAGFVVAIVPWLLLMVVMPNWWERPVRLTGGISPLSNPAYWLPNIQTTLATILLPAAAHSPRYHTFTTAFLNPALIALLAVGLLASLRFWRRPWWLSPVLVGAVMMLPNIVSNEPYQAVRLAGTWGPLALLSGLGMGQVLSWTRRPPVLRAAQAGLVALFVASPLYTAYHVWYHFKAQPLLANPAVPESLAYIYRLGYSDLLAATAASDTPVYLPVEYLNTDLGVARLRPVAFPMLRAYDGRPLPGGRVFLPVDSLIYGFFTRSHVPAQYALLLPESGEILILPPLPLDDARALEGRIQNDGDDILNDQGWILGQTLSITPSGSPFAAIPPLPAASTPPLALFDGRLELVALDAPQALTAGAVVPVTLYWRLRETTGKDYFARVQAWSAGDSSRSDELGSTIVNEDGGLLTIFSYMYPTVMWQAGEIVPETHWLKVFEDAPDGAYRFAITVEDYPGPKPVEITPLLAEARDAWLLAGQSHLGTLPAAEAVGEPLAVSARLGDSLDLTGARLQPSWDAVQPGSAFTVQLDWVARQPMARSYTLFVHVLDADGRLITQQDLLPFDGRFPTWAWPPGQTITTTHTLALPAGVRPPFRLAAGMYTYPTLERLPVVQDGVPSPDGLVSLAGDS